MDDRRIARAIAGTEPDLDARARRRRARWRVFFRLLGVGCFLAGAALVALLLRPLPGQAELQYTQGTIRKAGWAGTRAPRFEIALDQERRVFIVDDALVTRTGRELGDVVKPGRTARVGFAGRGSRQRAWDLAIDERTIYSLGDVRTRAARQAPPYWLAALSLLAVGVIVWFLTPPPRRRSRHHGSQC